MFEQSLYTYLAAEITSATHFWGKIIPSFNWDDGDISVNYFNVNNISSSITPTYLTNIQFSVRGKYIDAVQLVANEIITLFHLYSGAIEDYNVWVIDVLSNSVLYEEDDILQIPVIVSFKISQL